MNEPHTKPAPAAGMTTEQMRIALARAHGYIEQPDRFYIDRRAWTKNGIKHATIDLPHYPEDANAALEIVETLLERGWSYHSTATRFSNNVVKPYTSYGVALVKDGKTVTGTGATLPLAICEAACRALGHLQ